MRADWSRIGSAAAALLLAFAGPVRSEVIGPGYDLSIRVSMWDPASGSMQLWQGWPVDYAVDASGQIVLPLIGGVSVAQMEPAALASDISDKLIQQLSLAALPAVTVEISKRPPVMVLGLVRQAGPVDFRSGMTVREALAMTGGVPLSAETADDPMRTRLVVSQQINQLRQSEIELSAKAARLRAESTDATSLDASGLGVSASATEIVERERQILALDTDKQKRSIALLDGRLTLLKAEIEALNQKSASINAQQKLAKQQLDVITKLTNSGLAVNSRLLEAQRFYTGVESQSLEIRSSILSARQDIAKAEADRLQIVQGSKAAALLELSQTQSDLAMTRSKLELQARLVALIDAAESPEQALGFTIFHQGSDTPVTATADQLLQPGDIVQISLGLPSSG